MTMETIRAKHNEAVGLRLRLDERNKTIATLTIVYKKAQASIAKRDKIIGSLTRQVSALETDMQSIHALSRPFPPTITMPREQP